jgi:tetratricopeptide (TPR) repeat protein
MLDAAMTELDAAVEKGPFDRDVLFDRADLASSAKDWRKARGDLEQILDVNPADVEARQRLANVLLELGEDDKAATAVADTLRADPKRLRSIATDLLAQADRLTKKYPHAPSIPADWLMKALHAIKRPEFDGVLKRARETKTDADRLMILRRDINELVEK